MTLVHIDGFEQPGFGASDYTATNKYVFGNTFLWSVVSGVLQPLAGTGNGSRALRLQARGENKFFLNDGVALGAGGCVSLLVKGQNGWIRQGIVGISNSAGNRVLTVVEPNVTPSGDLDVIFRVVVGGNGEYNSGTSLGNMPKLNYSTWQRLCLVWEVDTSGADDQITKVRIYLDKNLVFSYGDNPGEDPVTVVSGVDVTSVTFGGERTFSRSNDYDSMTVWDDPLLDEDQAARPHWVEGLTVDAASGVDWEQFGGTTMAANLADSEVTNGALTAVADSSLGVELTSLDALVDLKLTLGVSPWVRYLGSGTLLNLGVGVNGSAVVESLASVLTVGSPVFTLNPNGNVPWERATIDSLAVNIQAKSGS